MHGVLLDLSSYQLLFSWVYGFANVIFIMIIIILLCMIFQLFARRSKHVPQKLRKHWDRLNLHYMSEEEDADEGDVIVVKKLPWRSDSKF